MLKKISLVLGLLLLTSVAKAAPVDDMVGVGIKPEQASEIDKSYVRKQGDTVTGLLTATGQLALGSETVAGAGTTGSRTLAASNIATALKVTSTRWIIS